MIVTCPSCGTKFNLPDENVQPGVQLRCSVCKHVFGVPETDGLMPGQLEEPDPDARPDGPGEAAGADAYADNDAGAFDDGGTEDADDHSLTSGGLDLDGDFSLRRRGKPKSRKGLLAFLLLVLILIGAAGGMYMFKPDLLRSYLPFLGGAPAAESQDLISKFVLRGVRQYSIANEKLGTLSVIEGMVVNNFSEPREMIKVEAVLFDKDGNPLDTKQQMAGPRPSLFQLQVLSEKDLEQALNNKIDILTQNTNVPPGGEVPFTIVFYKAPKNATEFSVKVIEAKLPPK